MRPAILLGTVLLCLSTSCQKQRYSQDSPEIDTVKQVLQNYDYQEWDKLITHYADSAKIYHNSREMILTRDDLPEYFQENDVSFSTRAFEDENREYEMVVDDQGQKWVNFWGLWKGNLAANNKEIVIPVHITAKFVDGKIVREYGYWNRGDLVLELQSIINAQVEADAEGLAEIDDLELED